MTRDERVARQIAEDVAVERIVQALLLVPDDDTGVVIDRATALARVRRADRAGEIAAAAHAMALGEGAES